MSAIRTVGIKVERFVFFCIILVHVQDDIWACLYNFCEQDWVKSEFVFTEIIVKHQTIDTNVQSEIPRICIYIF